MKIALKYHDRREEGATSLRQAQLIMLHLLEVVKKICDDHGLHYWLAHGTLLGALRHGGSIPWDDDLDIWMLKSEYEDFLKYAREELPDDVFLDLPSDDEAFRQENNLTRIRDNYSTGLIRHNKRLQINDHHGINIDIMLLEEAGAKNWFAEWSLHSYMSNRGWYRRANYDKITLWNLLRKWFIGMWVFFAAGLWKLSQLFIQKKEHLLQTNFYTAWKWWMPRNWFLRDGVKTRTIMYEGVEFPIPFEAEEILKMVYKDWHQLPPVEKRKGYLGIILPTTPCLHPAAMKWEEAQ